MSSFFRLNYDQKNEFANYRVTVMGLGQFGGGIGVARFLAEQGADVTVTDMKPESELIDSVRQLDGLGIRFVLGGHDMRDFTDAHMLVVSPAVPRESEYVKAARRAGARLNTEIGLFVERCPARICGITGSNGKSTTVSMLAAILERSGTRFWAGGNIGGSLLAELPEMDHHDIVVLELSSFQLEWLEELEYSPDIACILNILPNHLDRHGTFENYIKAKSAILTRQKTDDSVILVRDDPETRNLSDRARGKIIWVSARENIHGIILDDGAIMKKEWKNAETLFDADILRVPGSHNIVNAMAASACAIELGVDMAAMRDGLASFSGIPHRLEWVGEKEGVSFYNDSKATTPEAALAGITSFDSTVFPILGGYDKKTPFTKMAEELAGKLSWAALIGETAPHIAEELQKAGISSEHFDSLEAAFSACVSRAESGSVVLLSPGCASYGMFPNYEARGDVFRALVENFVQSGT